MQVLVFGDDTGPCLAVARSLGRRGIEVHLTTQFTASAASRSNYVTAVHPVPLYAEDGTRWVGAVRELIARHAFCLLVPTSDSSLENLMRHRDDFRGAAIAAPNAEAAAAFTDKYLTRQLARQAGVPVAEGTLVERIGAKWEMDGELAPPVVLKRRNAYRSGERAQKAEVLLARTYAELRRGLDSGRFDLVEAFLPGFCRGISVLARDGRVLMAHQHRRLRQKHPTGPGSSRVSEACDPQLLGWTESLVAATRFTGVAMFEYRHDPHSGRTVLLEVNPRFWGSLPLALAAGADFPARLFELLVEGREPPQAIGSRPGVTKLNLDYELHALSASFEQARGFLDHARLAASAMRLAARLVTGRSFDSWAADDPAPFRAERQQVLAWLRRALAARVLYSGRPRLEAAE